MALQLPCWSFAYLQSTSCRLQAQGKKKKKNRSLKSSKEKKKKKKIARFTAFPKFFLLIVVKSFCVKASASIKSSYMLQSHVFPFKLRFAECQPLDIINSKFVVSCCSLEPDLERGLQRTLGTRGDPQVAAARGEPRQLSLGVFYSRLRSVKLLTLSGGWVVIVQTFYFIGVRSAPISLFSRQKGN